MAKNQGGGMSMIEKRDFGGYEQYILGSDELELSVMTLGATVTGLKFRGRETVLRYDAAEDYLNKIGYINAAIGRYANRIRGARFSLNGREYILPANEGRNQLHGGPESYDRRVWQGELVCDDAVRFTLFSPDGDNGFPGNLTAAVTYRVQGGAFRMDFEAVSDADTVFAPTSHLYFNLDGSAHILDHELMINAGRYLEVDGELIPTGRLLPTEGDFDFKAMRKVAGDYDHCFVLSSSHACTVQAGGISMELHTDFPALQIYTASMMGEPFGRNAGLAIEPEFFPDSPNHPEFPTTLLKAGEKFHKYAEVRFKAV